MSMTREQMLHFLGNPDQLNEKTLIELKEILEEFPYFQSAHLLYVRNLMNEKNFRFAPQLKITAIHASDRTILYQLLNPSLIRVQKSEDQLSSESTAEKQNARILIRESKKHYELPSVETAYRLEGEVDTGKTLGQLVQDINKSAGKIKGDLPGILNQEESPEEEPQEGEMSDSGPEDAFITETLAKIYIKQGLYHKAIDAFQRLKLKYPEKSIYFAKQIDEVTNLLNK